MERRRNKHVVRHSDGWAVRSAGATRVSSTHPTQREAIETARNAAIRQGTEMLVHGRNGQIRERNTYGKDPFPPKG